jgi:hypothetical protein
MYNWTKSIDGGAVKSCECLTLTQDIKTDVIHKKVGHFNWGLRNAEFKIFGKKYLPSADFGIRNAYWEVNEEGVWRNQVIRRGSQSSVWKSFYRF